MTTKQDDVTQVDWERRIASRSARLVRLRELDAPQVIIDKEVELLERAITAWNTRQAEADIAELVEALGNEARLAFRIADEQNPDVVREAIHSMAHRLQALAKHRQSQENERG